MELKVISWRSFAVSMILSATSMTLANAATIVVNAKGDSAGGVNAHFNVLVNGSKIGEKSVTNSYQNFSFTTSLAASQIKTVMVHFDNNGAVGSEDRNLYVQNIALDSKVTASTASNVKYDKDALGGTDIVAGQAVMPWNGYLIYTFSTTATPAPTPGPSATPSPIANVKDSAPLTIGGKTNVVIKGVRIKNPNGNCITVQGSTSVIIENSEIGPCSGEGVYIVNSKNVTVRQTSFNEVRTGVYAVNSQTINVSNNDFLNMNGPMPRGQFVQYNNVTGTGNRINSNYGVNIKGQSNPEDALNVYQSSGTAADPIQVNNNYIRGGGPSRSGGGIMLGDGGKSNYITASGNVLVDPGQYGIAIAGGQNIKVLNNKVYGAKQSFTNVGIYVWNQYSSTCSNHQVAGNHVRWFKSDGSASSFWDGKNCANLTVSSTNVWQSTSVGANMAPPANAGITNR